LFGFSRGAFTARSIAGFIRNAGILKRKGEGEISSIEVREAFNLYCSQDHKPDGETSKKFREEHSHPYETTKIHFLGVYDTVGAVGLPDDLVDDSIFSHVCFHDTTLSHIIANARHALAIDEFRKDFAPTLWEAQEGTDSEQRWFVGVHSDVGGGYKETGLGDICYDWMVGSAIKVGLIVPSKRVYEDDPSLQFKPDPLSTLHDSSYQFGIRSSHLRSIGYHTDETVDPSVLTRFEKLATYRPKNPVHPTHFGNTLPSGLFVPGPETPQKGFVLPHNILFHGVGHVTGLLPTKGLLHF
jgi:hypothetical protein